MATVTKKDLIERIAEEQDCKRVLVKRIVQAFLDAIVEELSKGNRLEFRDFGVFESRTRGPRRAQNPKTLDKVMVPSRRTVKFKVGRVMKRKVEEHPPEIDEATGLPLSAGAIERRSSVPKRSASK
ncbi:MAG: HU family DNA-binding protein [Planctomycetota bacterium]|nr:MAG: HU family DNA-binding protein [Planctomycetota bacterium]